MNRIRFLTEPKHPARLRALHRRWLEVPPELRTQDQAIGRYVVGCGSTYGIHERCNFGCTACYLGNSANLQEPLPFEQVRDQLVRLRAYLGPGGNVQITSGEVTLLPVAQLLRIIRTARDNELSPMVMTHGDVFLHDSDYLDRLVTEGGLRKVSFHVDITQRGRKGLPISQSEGRLNEVRDWMAHLLRTCRRRTGVKLGAATTLTVNTRNLEQLRDVVDWFLDNLDCFRIMSLQPQARTGRTRSDDGITADQVWTRLEEAVGLKLNPQPFRFGHQACTRFALLLAVETPRGRFLLEGIRDEYPMDRRLVRHFLTDFAGVVLNEKGILEKVLKLLGVMLGKPVWFWRLAWYVLVRSWQERAHIPTVLGAFLRMGLRIRPLAFVVHAFMDAGTLKTELGRQRLAACVFKLPVNGKMVSMCEMNGTDLRESTYPSREKVEPPVSETAGNLCRSN